MGWQEDVEIVVGRTKHARYRELCADSHPDHDAYRALMVARAAEPWLLVHPLTPQVIEVDGTRRASSAEEMAEIRAELAARAAAAPRVYPSWGVQAGNLWRSAVGFVASGFKLSGAELVAARVAICEACPHYDAKPKRCTICGCKTKGKAYVESDTCPIGKW